MLTSCGVVFAAGATFQGKGRSKARGARQVFAWATQVFVPPIRGAAEKRPLMFIEHFRNSAIIGLMRITPRVQVDCTKFISSAALRMLSRSINLAYPVNPHTHYMLGVHLQVAGAPRSGKING
jgi:hypothetical protein